MQGDHLMRESATLQNQRHSVDLLELLAFGLAAHRLSEINTEYKTFSKAVFPSASLLYLHHLFI
jgi:hypothetical protein